MSTTIDSLSSGLIQSYINYGSMSSFSTDDMFRSVSMQVGGDGKSITKDELDTYIKNAGSDVADLSQLKVMQTNWDTISGDEDSITSSDMKDYTKLLTSAISSNISQKINSNASSLLSEDTSLSATDKIYGYLIDSAVNGSNSTTTSGYDLLNSYLSELLSNNSYESDNSDEIDAVINMIGAMQEASLSTVSFEV